MSARTGLVWHLPGGPQGHRVDSWSLLPSGVPSFLGTELLVIAVLLAEVVKMLEDLWTGAVLSLT